MRIVDIRETAIPLKSKLRNSRFDFSEMTTSVVAVITDVMRDGKPVAGFAFNSTGRYACGAQMRDRFIPRIMRRRPKSLLDDARRQSRSRQNSRLHDAAREARRPHRALGRHRHHRSRGLGCGRQDRRQAAAPRCSPSATTAARSPTRCSAMSAAAGTCRARASGTAGRNAPPSRRRLHHDEDQGRRLPLAEDVRRVEAVQNIVGAAPTSLSMPTPSSTATRRSPTPRRSRRSGCAGSRSRAIRSTTRCSPRSRASTMPPWRPARTCSRRRTSTTWFASAGCRPTATSSRSIRRSPTASRSMRARSTCSSDTAGRARAVPARRQPDVARHRRRFRPRRCGILSRRVRCVRRLCRRRQGRERLSARSPTGPASASRASPRSIASCGGWSIIESRKYA